jgi:hypothetical protein
MAATAIALPANQSKEAIVTEKPGLLEIFVAVVERRAALWNHGKIPEGPAREAFISRILEESTPDSDRLLTNIFSVEEWLAFRDEAAGHLAIACDCVSREQATRWAN